MTRAILFNIMLQKLTEIMRIINQLGIDDKAEPRANYPNYNLKSTLFGRVGLALAFFSSLLVAKIALEGVRLGAQHANEVAKLRAHLLM